MKKSKNFNLTQREEEVLNLLLKGHSNTTMAKLQHTNLDFCVLIKKEIQ